MIGLHDRDLTMRKRLRQRRRRHLVVAERDYIRGYVPDYAQQVIADVTEPHVSLTCKARDRGEAFILRLARTPSLDAQDVVVPGHHYEEICTQSSCLRQE